MADVFDKEKRSWIMGRIKSKGTKPELIVRSFLHKNGYRFRLHYDKLPGKPDVVLPRHKLAIFINGCFWHAHENCKYFTVPKTKSEWWINKLMRNKINDTRTLNAVKKTGWNVYIIWACELKPQKLEGTLRSLLNYLEYE
jgi:DNA mismatch endonuclease, patch repair protein